MLEIKELERLLHHIPSSRRLMVINAILSEEYEAPQMVSLPYELVARLQSTIRYRERHQAPFTD
ncbi:MAG: hypothetical protein JRI66_09585 [Deltaproteobacteria bacterium]|nr:hypothetical protein [Deltaproteobacteria bacterium]